MYVPLIRRRPQMDYYGMARVLHQMLVNKDLVVVRSDDGDVALGRPLPAWLHGSAIWQRLFTTLLNSSGTQSSADTLVMLRGAFEDFLSSDQSKAKAVNGALLKLECDLALAQELD